MRIKGRYGVSREGLLWVAIFADPYPITEGLLTSDQIRPSSNTPGCLKCRNGHSAPNKNGGPEAAVRVLMKKPFLGAKSVSL